MTGGKRWQGQAITAGCLRGSALPISPDNVHSNHWGRKSMNVIASPGQLRASFLRWTLVLVPLVLLLGFVSWVLGGSGPQNSWFAGLTRPTIYPPAATFGIVWSVLYVMMALALAMIAAARGAAARGVAIAAFVVQLLLNLAWSPVFFGMHLMTCALYILIALDVAVLITVALFYRVRKDAGLLLVPYLAWVCFATVLNWQFLAANPDADGRPTSNAVTRIEL